MRNSTQVFSTFIMVVIGILLVYIFVLLAMKTVVANRQYQIQSMNSAAPSKSGNGKGQNLLRISILPNYTSPFAKIEPDVTRKVLDVPFVSEAPDNNWTGSWKNACEEASITMVDKYYQGIKEVSIPEEKKFMQKLFDAQVKLYGSDVNSDAARSLHLIDEYTTFDGDIVEGPTIEDFIDEIDEGRPVIAFHRGFDLKNENIPFLNTGSSYHSTVVVGYDRTTSEFLVHDPGDNIAGTNHKYNFELFMNSLHDYDYKTHTASGPARVIFTRAIN